MWGYAFYLGTDKNIANRLMVSAQKEFKNDIDVHYMAEMEVVDKAELKLGYWLIFPYSEKVNSVVAFIETFIEEQKIRPEQWSK